MNISFKICLVLNVCILLYFPGTRNIHRITQQGHYELRIDLEDFEGNTRYALYKDVSVAASRTNFHLGVGKYSGDAGI